MALSYIACYHGVYITIGSYLNSPILDRNKQVFNMSNTVSVIIPEAQRQKAKCLGINISEVCRNALADEVSKKERETHNGGINNATG